MEKKIEKCISKISEELDYDEDYIREIIRDFLVYREFKDVNYLPDNEFNPKFYHKDDEEELWIENSDSDSDSDFEPSSSDEGDYSSGDEDFDDNEVVPISDEVIHPELKKILKETIKISKEFYTDAMKALDNNKIISEQERKIIIQYYLSLYLDENKHSFQPRFITFNKIQYTNEPYYFTINNNFSSEEIFEFAINRDNFILLVCSLVNNNYKIPSSKNKLHPDHAFNTKIELALEGIKIARKYKLPITWLHNRVKTKLLLDKLIKNSDIVKLIMKS